jgi:peptidoglycan/LPS O-acetylase OafA/YrhL
VAAEVAAAPVAVPAGFEHARRERLGYRPALDGLRAVAILSVMAGHTWGWLLPGGFVGVDIFFVLSGFLITTLLLEERERTGRISLRLFYARRALRLLPALGALVVAVVVWILVTSPTPLRAATIHGLPAVVLYVANLVWGLWHINLGLFGHTWSLSLEEQFYVMWPAALLALLSFRRGARSILALCVVAIVGAMLLRWEISRRNMTEDGLRRLTNLRIDVLLVGCALALAAARGWLAKVPRWLAQVATVVSLGVLVFYAALIPRGFNDPRFYRGGFTLVALATAVLIARIVHIPSRPLLYVLSLPAMVWIGRISYALYLWHTPIRDVVNGSVGGSPYRALVVWPLAFGAAIASYFLVERPALRFKDRFVPRDHRPAAAALDGAGAGAGAGGGEPGLPG